MVRGGAIITTFFFSKLLLKTQSKRYQIVGVALVLIGIIIVGISNVTFGSHSSTDASGVILF